MSEDVESDDSLLAVGSDDEPLLFAGAAESKTKSATSTSMQSAQKTVQRGRGRPPGSKDVRPRKKAKNAVTKKLFEHDDMEVDGGGQETEATTRLKIRQVENLPRTGLYEIDSITILNGMQLPLFRQEHFMAKVSSGMASQLSVSNSNRLSNMPIDGPFCDRSSAKYWSNRNVQLDLAYSFGSPLEHSYGRRNIAVIDNSHDEDSEDVAAANDFITSGICTDNVLFAAYSLHSNTRFDFPRTSLVSSAWPRNFRTDLLGMMQAHGVHGPPCGVLKHKFWEISLDNIQTTSTAMLTLVSCLCAALNGKVAGTHCGTHIDYHPGVNTKYTELVIHPRTKSVGCVRMQDSCNLLKKRATSVFFTSDEINDTLLNNVIEYRQKNTTKSNMSDDTSASDFIPACRNINIPALAGSNLGEQAEMPVPLSYNDLFEVSMQIVVYNAIDENLKPRKIKMTSITVEEKAPGLSFIVALQQILQTQIELQPALNSVLGQMSYHMYDDSTINLQAFFEGNNTNRHAATMLAEDNLILGLLQFGLKHKIKVINFGGSFLQPFHSDISLYKAYLRHVHNSRYNAFWQVSSKVNCQDLQLAAKASQIKLPCEDIELDGESSYHYRWISRDEVETMIQDFKNLKREANKGSLPEEWESEFDRRIVKWVSEQLYDDTTMYIPVGGCLNNSGIHINFNLLAFSYTRHTRRIDNILPQPIKIIPMVRIYLQNKIMIQDPFDIFFTLPPPSDNDDDEISLPVVDKHYLRNNDNLAGATIELRDALQTLTADDVKARQIETFQDTELMQLYGKVRHPISDQLAEIGRTIVLKEMIAVKHQCFKNAMRDVLDQMSNGELKQWQWTAKLILNLYQQGKQNGSFYKTTYKTIELAAKLTGGRHVCDDAMMIANWQEIERKRADQKLAWTPHMIIDLSSTFSWANFGYPNGDEGWGATLRVSDGGASLMLLGKYSNENFHERYAMLWNIKRASVGIDMMIKIDAQSAIVYCKWVPDSQEIQDFFHSASAKTRKSAHLSAAKACTYLGCGIKADLDGKISRSDLSYTITAGCKGSLPDMNKLLDKQGGLDKFEPNMGSSGNSEFVTENLMETHIDGKNVSVVKLLNFPCGWFGCNRLMPEPSSVRRGGRIREVVSPVVDGDVGQNRNIMYKQIKRSKSPLKSQNASSSLARPDVNMKERASIVTIRSQSSSQVDTKKTVPRLTKSHVMEHRAEYLCQALNARPFVHRVMTLGYILPFAGFTLSCDIQAIQAQIYQLTKCCRKEYFNDQGDFKRSFDGGAERSTFFPKFMQETMRRCVMHQMNRASMIVSPDLSWEENQTFAGLEGCQLLTAVEDAYYTCVQTPMTFTSILSSLYYWISLCVLNFSHMIITCYCLSMLGFRTPCSLQILAMAVNDTKMSHNQWQKYTEFCEALWPILCKDGVGVDSDCSQHNGCLVDESVMQIPSSDDLETWFSYESDSATDKIDRDFQERAHPINPSKSVYIRPTIKFVSSTVPTWVDKSKNTNSTYPAFGVASNLGRPPQPNSRRSMQNNPGKKPKTDKFVTGSTELKLAEAYSQLQTPTEDEARHASKMASSFQNTTSFWENARNGTRLPQNDTKSPADAGFDFVFTDPENTGFFFQTAMEEIKGCDGPLVAFLNFCGMNTNSSRRDLFTALLLPFAKSRGLSVEDISLPSSRAWTEPILKRVDKAIVVDKPGLAWGCLPCHGPQGVEIILAMDVLYYVLGSAMYCTDWTYESTAGAITITQGVHLRNLGHAAKAILELWIHTSVDKAIIPDGNIFLQAPSPSGFVNNRQGGVPVELRYCPEIHSGNIIFRSNFAIKEQVRPANVLNHNMRRSENFRLIKNESSDNCDYMLYYLNVMESDFPFKPACEDDIFLFPPESTHHMPTHTLMLQEWQRAYKRKKYTRDLALVIQQAGESAEGGVLGTIPITFTQAMCGYGREIPCVCLNNNFMFVLVKDDEGLYEVIPVDPTHFQDLDRVKQWAGLPLQLYDDKIKLSLAEVQLTMLDGFWYDKATDEILTKESKWWERVHCKKLQQVPWMPVPSIAWNHLVEVCPMHQAVRLQSDPGFLRLVDVISEYKRYMILPVSETENRELFASYMVNIDVFINSDEWKLEIAPTDIDSDMVAGDQCGLWVTDCRGRLPKKYFFVNLAHLQYALHETNNDITLCQEFQSMAHTDKMAAKSSKFDATNPDSYVWFPINYDDKSLYVEVAEYNWAPMYAETIKQMENAEWKLKKQKAELEKQITQKSTAPAGSNTEKIDAQISTISEIITMTENDCKACHAFLKGCRVVRNVVCKTRLADDNTTLELDVAPIFNPISSFPKEEDDKDNHVLAMITPQGNGMYLQNGDYNISFAIAGKEEGQCIRGTLKMDFMSIMRCLVPECSSVYIALTHDVYTTLRSIKPAFRVNNLDLHNKLSCEMSDTSPGADDEDSSLICWLRAYYLLGGTEYMENVEPEDMAVRLLIAVQSRTNNDDDGDCDTYAFTENHNIDHLMVYCSLLEQNFAQLLRTQPFTGGRVVDNLVHDVSRILVPSKRVQVGPGTSVMWFAKPTE